ncbi:hypothetical protein GCM10022291_08270 [Postechiella marina]|uniref:PKD domain-containing protein n=1 Tax=Postechiella marina TaxID=943941 RepID=A0ABP8C2Y4_9FLAO
MINKLFKKSGKSTFALCFIFLACISCYDNGYEEFVPPTGNVNNIQPNTLFTTSTDANDNLAVVFRSYSTDAASYLWDFGNGSTSTEANPDYKYSEGGLYTVKLKTTSTDGLVAEASSSVSPIFVDFNFTMIDSEVTFENISSGASSLVWDFGDGEIVEWNVEDTEDDDDFSPVHAYKTDETFVATLTATNYLGAKVSVSKNIEGLVLSTVPDFTFNVSTLSVDFTDASILAVSHSWDFGDGNTSTEVNPSHVYAVKGTYDVVLTTTNNAGVSRSITKVVPVGGVEATFAAVLQNADMQSYPTSENNTNDLVDAWTVDPDNTFNNKTDTPYNFWRNDALEAYVSALPDAGTDKVSSSGTDAKSAGGISDRSLKTDSNGERAYQPFEVEVGVEYTISAFVRKSGNTPNNLIGTFYILSDQPAQDDAATLQPITLVKNEVNGTASGGDEWIKTTFSFEVDATFGFSQSRVDENTDDILTSTDQKFVLFYFVPNDPKKSGNVFLTDVVLSTPGF